MKYQVTNGQAAALNAQGDSRTLDLQLNHPVVRSRSLNLYAQAQVARTDFENESSGSVTSKYRKRQLSGSLQVNSFDTWQGGGANSASVGLSQTILSGNRGSNAASLPNQYSHVNLTLSRNQFVTESVTAFVSARKQHTAANTDSSDNFIAGGPSGVRAYPSGEGSAPEGTAASAELRWRANSAITTRFFYDWARVQDRDDQVGRYLLRGWGGGADIQLPIGATLSFNWAKPKGSHPNPSQADANRNQDGTRFGIRTWASLSYQF